MATSAFASQIIWPPFPEDATEQNTMMLQEKVKEMEQVIQITPPEIHSFRSIQHSPAFVFRLNEFKYLGFFLDQQNSYDRSNKKLLEKLNEEERKDLILNLATGLQKSSVQRVTLCQEASQKDSELTGLQQSLFEQKTQIQALSQKNAEVEVELKQSTANCTHLRTQLADKDKQVKDKDLYIAGLKKQLTSLQEANKTLTLQIGYGTTKKSQIKSEDIVRIEGLERELTNLRSLCSQSKQAKVELSEKNERLSQDLMMLQRERERLLQDKTNWEAEESRLKLEIQRLFLQLQPEQQEKSCQTETEGTINRQLPRPEKKIPGQSPHNISKNPKIEITFESNEAGE